MSVSRTRDWISSLIVRLIGILKDPILIFRLDADDAVRTIVHLGWGPELRQMPSFNVCKHRLDQSAVADQRDELTRVLTIDVSDCRQSSALQLEESLGAGHIEFVGSCQKCLKDSGDSDSNSAYSLPSHLPILISRRESR